MKELMEDIEYAEMLRRSIKAYREGSMPLGRLVGDVESIADSMSESEGREKIRSEWWTLEQVYAVEILDREAGELPESAINQVTDALQRLDEIATSLG
ncbi:hypothetical protein [Streptomyces sp. NBC_01187]|uniref:hypothetical protein n=1 Tax=Streptomyces sp. NBC_01187 TaxID=2903766 RepID=UPI003869E338|nr:hypothetical protein OG220_32290 [Streptomyces sp. NBC_01187]